MSIAEIISWERIDLILADIFRRMHVDGPINNADFETLAYIKKFHSDFFASYEKNLMYFAGLFYKTSEPTNFLEQIYSIYADAIKDETGKRFTPMQASAYKKIHEKRYFSFSAPTSSGKSFLFRELIQHTERDIIIVVPSRALIAEYLLSVKTLVWKEVLVLPFIENVNTSKIARRVYIITPERGDELFKQVANLNIELFLFDEAHISEEWIRGMKFDSFVRRADRVLPNAKKVFTHPFVNNPEAQLKKHNFQTNAASIRYDQNSVGKIYLSVKDGVFEYFSPFALGKNRKERIEVSLDPIEETLREGWTLLVYTSKQKIYDGQHLVEFAKYINLCGKITDSWANKIIENLCQFIWATRWSGRKHSTLIEMMERGIVIHHWSMPLRARLLIEQFVNDGYARICFATSTLIQGINMPFNTVWLNNFYNLSGNTDSTRLSLKNLIWRAWRSTNKSDSFDYGFVIVESENVPTFSKNFSIPASINETSLLDENPTNISEDFKDVIDAIKNDSFDVDLQLTQNQVERLDNADTALDIAYILDTFLINNTPITWEEYYRLSDPDRDRIKGAFKKIFIAHLRRKKLTTAESMVLSASIPILLWQIQWKSFREIVWLRHAFITNKDAQREIYQRLKKGGVSLSDAKRELREIKIRYSPLPTTLPNSSASTQWLFPENTSIAHLDYDIIVYDTYDYLDKTIALSLINPLYAAFSLFYKKTQDPRALTLANYIKYWTDNPTEIWLLKYWFGFEEIEWLIPYIEEIDETGISFSSTIYNLESDQFELIERYL